MHPIPPAVPDLLLRCFRGESDYARMAGVVRISERPEEVQDEIIPGVLQPAAYFDPYQDMILAEIRGDLVGYGRISRLDEADEERIYSLKGFLAPEWRRKGIGASLLVWLENRVGQVDQARMDQKPAYFRTDAKQHQAGLVILLERAGYQPWRYFYAMVRATLDDIPDLPLPCGVDVRPVLPEHYRAIWKTIDETARDEWGYRPFTEQDYQAWIRYPSFQPHLWQIAWDTAANTVVGHVLTYIDHAENEQAQRKRGYTEGIGVLPGWRRRGLATALIARSLRTQLAAGMAKSGLVVDSLNSSGATALYERCGFRVVERNAVYRKALSKQTCLSI